MIGVCQLTGLQGPQELDTLQESPGEYGQAREVDHGSHSFAQVLRQVKCCSVKPNQEQDVHGNHADGPVLDNGDAWTGGQSSKV